MLKRILLATAAVGLAAGAAVAALGPHDRTSLGSTPGGACAYCHNNTSTAALRGFDTGGAIPLGGWGGRPIGLLCYKCHGVGGLGAQNTSDAVYDNFAASPATHGFDATAAGKAIQATDGALDGQILTSNLPYTQGTALDCTSCHNVHENSREPFNVKANIEEMCVACHAQRRSSAHNNSGSNGAARATHPVDIAIADGAATGAGNTAGTNLNTPAAILQGAEWRAAAGWVLGPKTVNVGGTEQMGCPTCHVVHNTTKYEDYLAVNNDVANGGNYAVNAGAGARSELCIWCHATTTSAYTSVIGGTSDHPIDARWLNVGGATTGNTFYPRVVMLPLAWVGGTNLDSDTGAAEFINNGPTGYIQSGIDGDGISANNAGPHCSSCHDMHGAQDGTSLYQGPSAGREGGFCAECHQLGDLAPSKHHSTVNTDEPTGSPNFTSVVQCGHCHGTGAGAWKAHNGFADFVGVGTTKPVAAQGGTWFQSLCVSCHPVENPTNISAFGIGTYAVAGASAVTLPSSHGNPSGALSHVANEVADDNSSFNCTVPASFTANDLGSVSRTYIPKLGPSNVIGCETCHNLVNNVGSAAAAMNASGGWKANLLIGALYEDDNALDGKSAEGVAANETLRSSVTFSSPARVNRDLDTGRTGDTFCRMCHNDGAATGYVHAPAAHTNLAVADLTQTFAYPAPLPYPHGSGETGILISGNTVADSCVAPGARAAAPWNVSGQTGACGTGTRAAVAPNSVFVYSAANRMDCDSCHRPHNADNLSSGPGNSGNINAILEVGAMTSGVAGDANQNNAAANSTKTEPCLLCHDPYWQP